MSHTVRAGASSGVDVLPEEVTELLAKQGPLSQREYLAYEGNCPVEFSDGWLEVLPVPTTSHQLLIRYLLRLVNSFTTAHDVGLVLFLGVRVRLWPRKFREPDVVFMMKEHFDRIGERYWKGADLVMEVVSGGKRHRDRDLVTKRDEYARAGIAEYWIVDPQEERITVLRLSGKQYVVHGVFGEGDVATSHLLPGFTVDVREAFAQQALPAPARTSRKPRKSAR